MIHYVVTGATGFLGKAFVNKVIEEKEHVSILVRNKQSAISYFNTDVCIVEKELKDIESLTLEDIGCNEKDEIVVVHFAWEGTSGDIRAEEMSQLNNVRLSCDFLRRMRTLGCKRFINAGSIMEYEAKKTISTDGERPQRNMMYSIAKLSADYMMKTIAADIGVDYVNVIISNIYGPGERSYRFLSNVIRMLLAGEDLQLTEGKQLYDFIYIDDAINMIYTVSKKGKPFESYYIGNEEQHELRSFVKKVHEIIGGESKLNWGAIPFSGKALDYTEFDTKKVSNELGVLPKIDFEEGIRRTRDWILDNE